MRYEVAESMASRLQAQGFRVTRGFERGQYFLRVHGTRGPGSIVEARTQTAVNKILRAQRREVT